MNLENLNVQEMNVHDLTSVEGGNWLSEAIGEAVGYAVGVVVGTVAVAVYIVAEKVVDSL